MYALETSNVPQCRKLDGHHELLLLLILGLLMEDPAMYLVEICAKIKEVTGNCVQTSSKAWVHTLD